MFCPKCGRMNPDEEEFCKGCGAVLHEEKNEPERKKSGGKLAAAIVICAAAAVGAVVFALTSCDAFGMELALMSTALI